MDNSEARQWLADTWRQVLEDEPGDPDTEIDRLVNSNVLSIRYAILTQILGKIANQHRSLLFLQMGTGKTPGTWDARSFCSAVIVPWVAGQSRCSREQPGSLCQQPVTPTSVG